MDTLDELKMLVEYVLCRHGTLHKILSESFLDIGGHRKYHGQKFVKIIFKEKKMSAAFFMKLKSYMSQYKFEINPIKSE